MTTSKSKATLAFREGDHGESRLDVMVGEESVGHLHRRTVTTTIGRISFASNIVTIVGLTEDRVTAIDRAVRFDPQKAMDDTGFDRWLAWVEWATGAIYRGPRHEAAVAQSDIAL